MTVANIYGTQFGVYILYPDDPISKYIINNELWEGKLKDIFDKYITKDSVVIEVGAYIGDHTIYMSTLAKKIYSFEGQRHIFHQLCANLFLNKVGNVFAREMVLYDGTNLRLGTKENNDSYAIPNSISLLVNPKEYETVSDAAGIFFIPDSIGTIKTTRLDDVIDLDEKIDFIIVDAEGSDLRILKGARNIIERYHPIIVYEFNITAANIHGDSFEDYENFFKKFGYTTEKVDFWNRMAKYV